MMLNPNHPKFAFVVTDAGFCPELNVGSGAFRIKVGKHYKLLHEDAFFYPQKFENSIEVEFLTSMTAIRIAVEYGLSEIRLVTDCKFNIPRIINQVKLTIPSVTRISALHVPAHAEINGSLKNMKKKCLLEDNHWCDANASKKLEAVRKLFIKRGYMRGDPLPPESFYNKLM